MQTDKILEELYDTLKNAGTEEITLAKKEETGMPCDMIVMLIESFGGLADAAQCEIYFLTEEEVGTDMFFCRITLTEEVVEPNVPGLCAEISTLNYEVPLGAFSYDVGENALCYQVNLPLADAMTEKEIRDEAEGCIATAISVSSRYAGTLVPLATSWRI